MQYEAGWKRTWTDLGVQHVDPALLDALVQRYAEPHRKYHTLQHLDHCLENFAVVRTLAAHPQEVELALWFHDAIYEIPSRDNERQSAEWACAALQQAGVAQDVVQRVHALVMVTRHDRPPQTADEALLLDVDLAILGAPPPLFETYERQIGAEYCAVPEPLRRSRRRQILGEFMGRARIFHSAHFNTRLEAQARLNLARSIAALSQGG